MIIFYGHLRERFGEGFDLQVSSPVEAVRALCAVVPGFIERFREGSYQILVGDEPQALEAVGAPCGHLDISFVPVVEGGKSALMQVILGAALIVASFYIPGAYAWAAKGLMAMGTSMALGGVARMLAGSPHAGGPDTEDARNGSFFSGPENTIQQGACIPVGYGEMLIGSVVVSAGTSAEAYPCGSAGGPFGANPGTWVQSDVGYVWSNGGDGLTVPL